MVGFPSHNSRSRSVVLDVLKFRFNFFNFINLAQTDNKYQEVGTQTNIQLGSAKIRSINLYNKEGNADKRITYNFINGEVKWITNLNNTSTSRR